MAHTLPHTSTHFALAIQMTTAHKHIRHFMVVSKSEREEDPVCCTDNPDKEGEKVKRKSILRASKRKKKEEQQKRKWPPASDILLLLSQSGTACLYLKLFESYAWAKASKHYLWTHSEQAA